MRNKHPSEVLDFMEQKPKRKGRKPKELIQKEESEFLNLTPEQLKKRRPPKKRKKYNIDEGKHHFTCIVPYKLIIYRLGTYI